MGETRREGLAVSGIARARLPEKGDLHAPYSSHLRARGNRGRSGGRGLSGDRTFKHLQSAWAFIRKFHFLGRVTIYPAGDVELRQFVGVAPRDLEESGRLAGPAAGGTPAVSPSTADRDTAIMDETLAVVARTADSRAAIPGEAPPLSAANPASTIQ